jgi:hypothetical protein
MKTCARSKTGEISPGNLGEIQTMEEKKCEKDEFLTF